MSENEHHADEQIRLDLLQCLSERAVDNLLGRIKALESWRQQSEQ